MGAWESDIYRYNLTSIKEYAGDQDVSKFKWLTDTYPDDDLIRPEKGARSPRFTSWMRPAAKDQGWHPIGRILPSDLPDSKIVNVTIKSVFPVKARGGYKKLVFSELNRLGGDN